MSEVIKTKSKIFLTKPYVLIFLSAVLSALPLTFEYLFFLSWISFVPLFYVIIKHGADKPSRAFGMGFLFGFLYHLCIYYWFLWFYPLDFAGLTAIESVGVVLLASIGISLIHGILWCIPTVACFFAHKLNSHPWFLSFVAVIGIMTAQKLTSVGELSFPWARVSLGQYKTTALIQSASIFGIDGVDMLILSINALIAICIVSPPTKRTVAAITAAVLFTANLGYGLVKINSKQSGTELKIMTVQGSVSQNDKWSGDGDKISYDIYSTLTKENITDGVQLVLWPESAVPKVYKNENSLKQYKNLSKELCVPILAGVLLRNDGEHTNNATLITQDGVTANYAKRNLVPFGEYMPYKKLLSKLFPFLEDINIIEDNYISGVDSAIMETGDGKAGSIICFESIYPQLSRQSVLDGAEVLFEVTNDSWLKTSPAMTQHLAHGVFRSIENGRYLVRSANTGISAVIDSHGKIKNQLAVNERGVITDTVHLNQNQTLYTKTGDVLFPICVVVLFAISGLFISKNIKHKKSA